MTETIKEFFTDSEWDLIYNLIANNREFCEDDEQDPRTDYDSIVGKISKLFINNWTPMKCYSVIGGFDYEGENFDSLKLFDCRSSADAYYQKLVEVEGFDYAKIALLDVIMESAIAV